MLWEVPASGIQIMGLVVVLLALEQAVAFLHLCAGGHFLHGGRIYATGLHIGIDVGGYLAGCP